jgi:hypothetical protein
MQKIPGVHAAVCSFSDVEPLRNLSILPRKDQFDAAEWRRSAGSTNKHYRSNRPQKSGKGKATATRRRRSIPLYTKDLRLSAPAKHSRRVNLPNR